MQRRDYTVALNLIGTQVDDPDAMLYENCKCGGIGNYNGYCNPEIDRLIDRQSTEPDQDKRRQLVWEIAKRLVEDNAKPLIFFNRGGICWDPRVKNPTVTVNSIHNGLAHGRRLTRYLLTRPSIGNTCRISLFMIDMAIERDFRKLTLARQAELRGVAVKMVIVA